MESRFEVTERGCTETRNAISFPLFWRFGVLAANPLSSPIVHEAEGCDAERGELGLRHESQTFSAVSEG